VLRLVSGSTLVQVRPVPVNYPTRSDTVGATGG
jgi:hypothetical protein